MEQGNLEFESFNDRIHNQRVQCIFVAIVLCSYEITEDNVIVVAIVVYGVVLKTKNSKKVAHGVYICDYFLYILKNYVFILPFVTYYLQIV